MTTKRALVDIAYSSSDEDVDQDEKVVEQPAKKLKPLPKLNESLILKAPTDDPSLHQGRIRSKPHVEGQFPTHIYIGFQPDRSLKSLLRAIVARAKEIVPELHSLLDVRHQGEDEPSLHISLSRPIFLRAHQREELRRSVKKAAEANHTFDASLAQLTIFTNDENTRAFVSLEIGAGHSQLKALSDAMTPVIKSLYQEPYYSNPRFHASIAWALLSQDATSPASADVHNVASNELPSQASFTLATRSIPKVPENLLSELQAAFADDVRTLGQFRVSTVSIRIGKEVQEWALE